MNTKSVIFYCNWSSYPGLKLSRTLNMQPETQHKYLVSMCSGRISPELILQTFKKGVSGVLIAACPEDKCEHDGNYKTVGRIALLKIMLGQIGIDPQRLQLAWIDKGETAKLHQVVKSFTEAINNLGPITTN